MVNTELPKETLNEPYFEPGGAAAAAAAALFLRLRSVTAAASFVVSYAFAAYDQCKKGGREQEDTKRCWRTFWVFGMGKGFHQRLLTGDFLHIKTLDNLVNCPF